MNDPAPPTAPRSSRFAPRRLYLQIYLAFLGILVLSFGISMGIVRLAHRPVGHVPPFVQALGELLAKDLPTDPQELEPYLRTRGHELHMNLAVWSAEGTLLGATDPSHAGWPAMHHPVGPHWIWHPGRLGVVLPLADGRRLGVTVPSPGHTRFPKQAFALVLFAAFMGVGCYPLARRITRRLEALRRGVERMGEGELAARVRVEGRDEVADLARSFNVAAERIEGLMNQQRRMLHSASHELRSPLTRLRLALELLRDASPGTNKHWDSAAADIDELDTLVDDILLAARLEHPQAPRVRVPVRLDEILRRAAEPFAIPVPNEPAPFEGDPIALGRALGNLLQNAQRHGGQEIEVSIEARGGHAPHGTDAWWVITVADRGPGVAPEERERIFEPFYRPQGHHEGRDGGVGLGLSLVRQIARDHGGEVIYEPRPGGGSRFILTLPRKPNVAP